MKKYTAWTRSSATDNYIVSEVRANNISEARQRFKDQGREIEKGSLKLSKNQIG